MPKVRVEDRLEQLNALRSGGLTETAVSALRKALAERVSVVVARAAKISGELQAFELIPDLVTVFERMFRDPAKADPQCWAKNALAKALKDLGHSEAATFLKGVRHIQMEGVWGGQEDTAGVLRGTCALALVQCNDLPREEIFRHLVAVLTDKFPATRADAARAIEQMNGLEAMLLLRLKAGFGDRDARITGQVLESLLGLEGDGAVEFVAEFLSRAEEEIQDEAALALGSSRLISALDALQAFWRSVRRPPESVLRAIAISRHESGVEFLLQLVAGGSERDALSALNALELYRDSQDVSSRVKSALAQRAEPQLRSFFEAHFASQERTSSD